MRAEGSSEKWETRRGGEKRERGGEDAGKLGRLSVKARTLSFPNRVKRLRVCVWERKNVREKEGEFVCK